jgi:hypothetical protein
MTRRHEAVHLSAKPRTASANRERSMRRCLYMWFCDTIGTPTNRAYACARLQGNLEVLQEQLYM